MELRLSRLRPPVVLLEFNKQLRCETLLDKSEQTQRETALVLPGDDSRNASIS